MWCWCSSTSLPIEIGLQQSQCSILGLSSMLAVVIVKDCLFPKSKHFTFDSNVLETEAVAGRSLPSRLTSRFPDSSFSIPKSNTLFFFIFVLRFWYQVFTCPLPMLRMLPMKFRSWLEGYAFFWKNCSRKCNWMLENAVRFRLGFVCFFGMTMVAKSAAGYLVRSMDGGIFGLLVLW